jgi:multidrug efflux system membrane fusion protein
MGYVQLLHSAVAEAEREIHNRVVADNLSQQSPAQKYRKRVLWIAILSVVCGAGYLLSQTVSTQSGTPSKSKKGKGPVAVPVSVATITKGPISEFISALGAVTPIRTVTVTSRVAGELMEVDYNEGQIVKKGDLLAMIDPRPYEAVFVQAEGQLARDQAMLKNAFIDLTRYQQAYQVHAVPEQQLATQQATVEQDQGVVKLDQGNLDAAKVNVDYTRICSPIDGRVGLRLVDPGNIVPANGATGLLVITQLQPITVVFSVAEDYLSEVTGQLRSGHTLRVDALDRDQQKTIAHGTLLTIDNQIDTTTGTVKMKATFPNTDNALFPNEFVNAKLLVQTLNSVNLMPTAAIQHNGDVAFVYVIKPDGSAQSRNVTVATTDGEAAAVTGVGPGEVVAIDGFDKLQDGVKVSVRQPTAPDTQLNAPPKAPAAQKKTK